MFDGMNEFPLIKHNSFRRKVRNWMAKHPQINPDTFSKVGMKRILTASSRVLPDFLVLGVHKSGTSTLYNELVKHPNILSAADKEIHYFNAYFGSESWYRSNFPTKKEMEKGKNGKSITGEATAQYLFHPLVPKRVHNLLPNIEFLVVLRNPVERAFSHYNNNIRKGIEPLPFKDALQKRKNDLKEAEKMVREGDLQANRFFERYSYLEKGKYVEQFERWFEFFPKEKFFVFQTTEFQQNTWNKIFDFLNVSHLNIKDTPKLGKYDYSPIDAETKEWLNEFYKPYNEKLEKMFKIKLNWD